MRLTVAICTRNRAHLVAETLESVRASARGDLQIIVVDQSEDTRTRDLVQGLAAVDPRVVYEALSARGLSRARNRAAEMADGEVVAFVGDDCKVDPYWAAHLGDAFERDPDLAGAFGRLLPILPSRTGILLSVKDDPVPDVYHDRLDVFSGHGANMAFRRSVLRDLGGFDEALGPGGPLASYEDADLRIRVLASGGRIAYLPGAIVYQRQSRSWQDVRRMQASYGIGAGACAAKFIRLRGGLGLTIFTRWLWRLGFRQVVAGILRGQPLRATCGLLQLVYPWIGLARGLRAPLDRDRSLFSPGAGS